MPRRKRGRRLRASTDEHIEPVSASSIDGASESAHEQDESCRHGRVECERCRYESSGFLRDRPRGNISRNIAGFGGVLNRAGQSGIACQRRAVENRVQRTGDFQSTWMRGLSRTQRRRRYGGGFRARRYGQEPRASAPDHGASAPHRQDAARWDAINFLDRRRIESTRGICKFYFRLESQFPLRAVLFPTQLRAEHPARHGELSPCLSAVRPCSSTRLKGPSLQTLRTGMRESRMIP